MDKWISVVFIAISIVVVNAATSKCPRDWAEFDSECLLFSIDRRNWVDAHSHCRAQNAYLATDDNSNKHAFIRQIISVLDGERIKDFFIGASDQAFEGQWRWLETGIPLKGFTAWGTGKPSTNMTLANKHNCMKLAWENDEIVWTDWDCYDRGVHYICEKQAVDFQNATEIIGR